MSPMFHPPAESPPPPFENNWSHLKAFGAIARGQERARRPAPNAAKALASEPNRHAKPAENEAKVKARKSSICLGRFCQTAEIQRAAGSVVSVARVCLTITKLSAFYGFLVSY